MGTLCLSQALILRCESLTETESIALFIPTAVEFLFASSLIFRTWDSDRRHIFLTFEGWIYFALALLELLSHIIPAVRDDLAVFKVIDIVIGALSSIPLLLYTIFLCFFTCTEFLDGIPQRLQIFGKFMLIILIPVVIVFNEVASFIGITHRIIGTTVAVGFSNPQNKTLWTIFTDFDLGFITVYQALNFSFAFFRLAKAFLEQQRIESSDTDEALLIKGTGWVTLGIKLGAVESAIGFVPPQFGVVLARRILRFLGRALLIIGLLKGLDVSEDFQQVREEIIAGKRERSFRGSRLRPLISDPRLSTFRQLSPGAIQAASDAFRGKDPPRSFSSPSPAPMVPGERVTIHFNAASGQAPTLEMRFSALDIPSPTEIVESVKVRPASEWLSTAPSRRSSYYANSTMTRHTLNLSMPEMPKLPQAPGGVSEFKYASRSRPEQEAIVVHNVFAHTRDVSNFSTNSGFRDSVNSMSHGAGGSLSSKFPGIPPRVTKASQMALQDSFYIVARSASSESKSKENQGAGLSISNSFHRKPVPRASLILAPASIDPFVDEDTQIGVKLPTPLGTTEHAHQMSIALSTAPTTTKDSLFARPAESSPRPSSYSQFTPTTGQTEDPFKYDAEKRDLAAVGSRNRTRASVVPSELPLVRESSIQSPSQYLDYHDRGKSIETLDLSWLQPPNSGKYNESINSYSEESTIERAMRRKISLPSSIHPLSGSDPAPLPGSSQRRSRSAPRFKSIGKAPKRYTPSPTISSYTRESIYIEPIIIPPRQYGGFPNVEVEQGSLNGGSMLSGITGMDGITSRTSRMDGNNAGSGTLRDSNILGLGNDTRG
ncbi:hypothetical protein C8J55DRAFT_508626 [Lentinula edodes]|uniref:Transmembrane protein n=1 Tax=Lentinula lateritia TaxID=40482 RepID=A0A9W9AN61_9AGAR|nr:hypothetical protein C8J55DRAFT_508626 [Lentinula edodes]